MRTRSGLLAILLTAVSVLASAGPAAAAGPALRVDALTSNTIVAGTQTRIFGEVVDTGDSLTSGEIDLTATLPSGMTAVNAVMVNFDTDKVFTCTAGDGSSPVAGAGTVLCQDPTHLDPNSEFASDKFYITVAVAAGVPDPSTLITHFEVTGGGATPASFDEPIRITATPPPFGIEAFDGQVSSDPAGDPYTQAGGTPYSVSTTIDFNTESSSTPTAPYAHPVEPTRDISVDLPPGLVGATAGLPQCDIGQLALEDCPVASQIGTTILHQINYGTNGLAAFPVFAGPLAVFNMVPPPGAPARFGFYFQGITVLVDAQLRSGSDYGISLDSRDISEGLLLAGTSFTFWGVPADPSHDVERQCPADSQGSTTGASGADPVNCVDSNGNPEYTRPPLTSFLRLPTSCQGPLTTSAHIDSWFNPGAWTADGSPDLSDPSWKTASFVSHNPPGWPALQAGWGSPQGVTGCNRVPFDPTITVQPTSNAADSPTGLNVDLRLPQTQDPNQIGEADLKRAVVNLPARMSINTSAADGLGACTSAQIALHSDGPASCPDSAKLGTAEIKTPLLSDPLEGSIYLAKPQDNPFGTLLALYVVASGDGVNIKLPGRIDADPTTGQLTATFDDQPQLPFSDLSLSFFSGDRAALTTPPTCGTFTTPATFDSWANPTVDVRRADSFQITSGPNGTACPADVAHRPFAPQLSAGAENPAAGAYSPFVLDVTRQPGEQEITSLDATLPPGVLARLAGVSQCLDAALASIPTAAGTGAAEAAHPSCPANSLVGHVQIGVGAGTPYYVNTGRVYLAGPYKGAPYSLAIVTPALAGPFDLGNVVVRTALYVDPTDAHVTAVSDPLPTILDGIPLDIRDIRVLLDRPGFTLNPTSCDPMSVTGQVFGTDGLTANVSDRFQVGGCQNLPFGPKLRISLTGRGQTRSGDHPTLTGTLTAGHPNEANVSSARIALPLSLALDPNNSQHVCAYPVAWAVHGGSVGCPASTIVGSATAVTPLLDQPLTGPAYLVQGFRCASGEPTTAGACPGGQGAIRTLPSLLIALRGQIALDLRAQSSVNRAQQLVTTFSNVPDAFVSKFTLTITGGPKGLLVITGRRRTICGSPQVAHAQFTAHNSKTEAPNVKLTTPCATAKSHRPRHHEHS